MSYTFNPADVFDFASAIGADTKQKGNELFFKHCPYCGEEEGNFSINLDTGAFKCFRATCDKHGHFVELCRDFNYHLDFGEVKEYRKLSQPKQPIQPTDMATEYLRNRGISAEVVRRYSVTTRNDNPNNLVFPFFDETGALQFVKYRNISKDRQGPKEWCEKGTKPIFFGMKQCVEFIDRLIITEGQIDSLTLASCGLENCISVSNGANSVAVNVTNCYDWITQFKEIIVFGDWEYGKGDKMTLLDDLKTRLPNTITIKAVRKEDYLGEKDANDIFRKYGADAIATCINNAELPPVRFIKKATKFKRKDTSNRPKFKTRMKDIDYMLGGGICYEDVVVISGYAGEGKTTFSSQLVAEALDQGVKTFIYSGEISANKTLDTLEMQLAGNRNVSSYTNEDGRPCYVVSDTVRERMQKWYDPLLYLYDNDEAAKTQPEELEAVLTVAENAIRCYGCKLIVIDNLMTAMEYVNDDLFRSQSEFVFKLKRLALVYQVAVILIAHPKKPEPGRKKYSFTIFDVAGSLEIANRVDIVMCYQKYTGEDKTCNALLHVVKNRDVGDLTGDKPIELYYSKRTKQVACFGADPNRAYGWESVELTEDDYELVGM